MITTETPVITFGKYLKGFSEWYVKYFDTIKSLFTPEVEEIFEDVENFAVELFIEIKLNEA